MRASPKRWHYINVNQTLSDTDGVYVTDSRVILQVPTDLNPREWSQVFTRPIVSSDDILDIRQALKSKNILKTLTRGVKVSKSKPLTIKQFMASKSSKFQKDLKEKVIDQFQIIDREVGKSYKKRKDLNG